MKRLSWLLLGLALLRVMPSQAADTVVYYHTDALHSVAVVTNASGQVIERTHYAPYGQVLDRSLRDGPGYGGHEEDAATGLVYMQQRYYDPETGRFLSVDPVPTDPNTGANFNRYWYASDNPYRYTDPDGRQTTGEFIDQQAQAASDQGNYVATYLWAFAGTAWNYLGAESVSQVADKGAGASTDDKVMAAITIVTLGKGEDAVTAVKDVGEVAEDAAKGALGNKFSSEKQALVEMAKGDKKTGMTTGDMQAYKDLNKELPDPFPANKVRGPEAHSSGGPHSQEMHGHVGPVNHIPIKQPPPPPPPPKDLP